MLKLQGIKSTAQSGVSYPQLSLAGGNVGVFYVPMEKECTAFVTRTAGSLPQVCGPEPQQDAPVVETVHVLMKVRAQIHDIIRETVQIPFSPLTQWFLIFSMLNHRENLQNKMKQSQKTNK